MRQEPFETVSYFRIRLQRQIAAIAGKYSHQMGLEDQERASWNRFYEGLRSELKHPLKYLVGRPKGATYSDLIEEARRMEGLAVDRCCQLNSMVQQDPDEGPLFVMGIYKVGAEVERRTSVCYYCKSPDHLIRDCALFETAQESLNIRGGVDQNGKLPPHKEDLLVAAKAALEQPQYLRHCESFLHSELKRGKGRRRRQNPFQRRPVTQCSSSVPGAGPGELGIVSDPYTRWCGIENIS